MAPIDVASFATSQLSLLDAELQAELAESSSAIRQLSPAVLQRAGLALANLVLETQRTGLGGRTILELEPDSALGNGNTQEHGIRVGDIVRIQEQHAGAAKKREIDEHKGVEGTVTRVKGSHVSVALRNEEDEIPAKRLWMVKVANDITYKRMNDTMTKLKALPDSEQSPLMRVLFGLSSPTPVVLDQKSADITFMNLSLNESQKEAIRFALASPEVALIHGPPGTGKTHTLIELIRQLVKQGRRLLVCGPSNLSVDNIVERLAPHRVPMIRLGHPARLLPSVLDHSLDVLSYTSDAAAIVRDIRAEMDAKQRSIKKTRSGRERKAVYNDLKMLRKDYKEREKRCVNSLMDSSKVVLATLHGAGGFHLRNQQFDVVLIDEASQALEAQCWVPLFSAKKVVLAGDHLQLPPTVKSSSTSTINGLKLETTLFDRLLDLYGSSIKKMLTVQYRMHTKIMTFPSRELYNDKLIADDGVKARLLSELSYGVTATEDTVEPLVFWDTQGGDFPETTTDKEADEKGVKRSLLSDSKSNELEAALATFHLSNLVAAGVHAEDIALVTPYNAQLALLADMVKEAFPGVELGSIDGFQGREKEAVILSLVRSNPEREVGFLSERRRLNVAMTRPRRHLCIIGDSETVARGNPYLKRWMAFLEDNADLRYPDPSNLQPDQ